MSGGTVPLRLISLILLFSLIPPARASYVAPKQIWTNKWDNCFAAAGARYQIEPLLLKAISAGESSLRPGAININKDKKTGKASSTDYGLMQINSTHIPKLINMGVIKKSEDLITKPCLNSKRLVRTVLIFTESSDQLSRATDRVPGLPASPGYV
ncbi:hypothetical protein DTL75_25850, partial [Escherichia coli]